MVLIDGLGGEELGQPGSQVSSMFLAGSVTTQSNVNAAGTISGAGNIFGADIVGLTSVSGLNVYGAGSVIGSVLNTGDGAVSSISVDSGTAGTFGPRIQVGSCLTGAEGFGSAIFNTQFTNTNYYFNAAIGSTGGFLTVDAGSWVVTISGIAGRNISGVTFKGASSSPYTWVAIGL